MLTSTLFVAGGIITGSLLVASGIRDLMAPRARMTAIRFPRWRMVDNRELGRMGARKRQEKARLRYQLVAVNSALESIKDAHMGLENLMPYRTVETLECKRHVMERMVYGWGW